MEKNRNKEITNYSGKSDPEKSGLEQSDPEKSLLPGVQKFLAVVARLRDPDGGCPWDLKQTHESLKPYLLEEAYETLEAIDLTASGRVVAAADRGKTPPGNPSALLCEELGDVLLQIGLHAQIAADNGQFNFNDVADGIAEKLIRRHPHVFADTTVSGAEEVTRNWEAIKQAEKAAKGEPAETESILDGIPKHLPALSRALTTSKRAVKVGFEWPSTESLWACVMSEFEEFREVTGDLVQPVEALPFEKLEEEMGDIFFATVNLARHYKIDPEVALTRATHKFTRRFQEMERQAAQPLETLDFETWDRLWEAAKKTVDSGGGSGASC